MNPHWKNFLQSQNASFLTESQISFPASNHPQQLYPVTQLAVLTVSGKEAGKFLQGQITCNVQDISSTQSSLGALCNPKGRVISTFLLVQAGQDFLLVLPIELLPTVKERLQKYVLRSAVTLTDSSDSLCLFGLQGETAEADFLATYVQDAAIRIQFGNRYLFIADADHAIELWRSFSTQGFQAGNSAQWQYLDIAAGIPWLMLASSEHFIPQMLNLDKLGGISLTKGCYTGQEIVARTHYLGKAKRALYLAECAVTPETNSDVIDSDGQVVGTVLCAERDRLLLVLQQDSDTAQLRLNAYNQAPVTILPIELS
jgi:tRNA-modifying protein YgfZ